MKRIFALFLAAVLLPVAALADLPDISSLTLDELTALNQRVQLSMFEKGSLIDGVKVSSGIYTVGVDIPAGVYRIEYRPMLDTSFCSFMAYNESDENFLSFITTLGFDSSTEISKIDFANGTHVEISGGDVYFYTYTGLFH